MRRRCRDTAPSVTSAAGRSHLNTTGGDPKESRKPATAGFRTIRLNSRFAG